MNPILNPFAPGAGSAPPELAGRNEVRETVRIAIERIRRGHFNKSVLLVGLRGVGKTVLLDQMRKDAENTGIHSIRIEAPEERSLPAVLAPQLRLGLLRLSRIESAKDLAQRGLKALAGFAKALKVKFEDIEVGFDTEPEPGLADNGDLEHDLQALLETVGAAAKQAGTALVIFIDELQYVEQKQLEALITALHRIAQAQMPVVLIGAGLPQLRAQMGRAKSYAERLFDFSEIGPLNEEAARIAIQKPITNQSAQISPDALTRIITQTQGYPYFLQEWGKHAWNTASTNLITLQDVEFASESALTALDESFFRVRFDRCTPFEKRYLRAMAELGAGPHRSGDIATILGRKVSSLGPTRSNLLIKGMIWSPSHGDTGFTVPLFDQYMKRIMPDDQWKTS